MKVKIKKYLNVFQYLQDIYSERKVQDPKFSYDIWAKELQASDKSYVRLMVIGKRRINEKMAHAFCDNIGLAGDERSYFLTLIQYTQSKDISQRDLFGKALIGLLKSELDQLEVQSHFEFLSNPLLPRLQIFLGFLDLNQSMQNLAWLLQCSEKDIQEGMQKLEELELIYKEKSGLYRPAKKSFKVPDNFGNLGLEAFYTNNLEEAKSAISLPKEERRFKSLFLPLDDQEFETFWGNLQNFVNEQLIQFNPDHYAERRLYQTHFNIIPISAKSKRSAELED